MDRLKYNLLQRIWYKIFKRQCGSYYMIRGGYGKIYCVLDKGHSGDCQDNAGRYFLPDGLDDLKIKVD